MQGGYKTKCIGMKWEPFGKKKFNILTRIKTYFMPACQQQYFHAGDIADLVMYLIYSKSYRIIATEAKLYRDICTVSDSCFGQ